MSSPTPERGSARARSSERVTADRLSSMLFVATLAHGVLILGVTFTASPPQDASALPSLNVTLVVDSSELDEAPEDAEWLAQANQLGGGRADEGPRPTTTLSSDQPATLLADPAGLDIADGKPREAAPEAEQLLTRGPSDVDVAAVPKATETPAPVAATRAALLDRSAAETLAAEIDERAELPENGDPSRVAAPSTEQSILAEYLDAWRRRVERIGTANFPESLKSRPRSGRPTLEVAIGADGALTDIVVRRSSGDPALDQAALTILRLAAPFEPLPDEIRARYDVLRFAYEWDFTGGAEVVGGNAAAAALAPLR